MGVQITIRDVPERVRDELASRAARQGRSMQEFLKQSLESLAAKPSPDRWLETVRQRKQLTDARIGADDIVEARDHDRSPVTVVVDAAPRSCIAALVDNGPDGRWAESLLLEGTAVAPQLPPPLLVESTNVGEGFDGWRTRGGQALRWLDASAAHRDLMALTLDLYPFEPLSDRVWALRFNLSSYDAWYVIVLANYTATREG